MIDRRDKADRLKVEMEALLPLETTLSPHLKRTLAQQSPEATIPDRCMVTSIFYMGALLSHKSDIKKARTPTC